jgi:DNA repair protein RadA/Sms
MILAVLDARAGLGISAHDVYLNVAGGLKIAEPAADLAAAAALISSFSGETLPPDCVFFGELSLSGDVRPAPQTELRLKEAAKLGFKRAYVPAGTKSGTGLELHPVESVVALAALAGGQNGPKRAAGKSLPEHP